MHLCQADKGGKVVVQTQVSRQEPHYLKKGERYQLDPQQDWILSYQATDFVFLTIQMPGKKTSKTWDKTENLNMKKLDFQKLEK